MEAVNILLSLIVFDRGSLRVPLHVCLYTEQALLQNFAYLYNHILAGADWVAKSLCN